MSDPGADIRAAELREAAARARLTTTLHELQGRLKPRVLARDAARKATDAGRSGADAARRNPLPVAGAAAAALLFLARRRIAGLFRRKKASKPSPKDDANG